MERELRKAEHLCGTWVYLGNGESWCIPALPLGKSRIPILAALRETWKFKEELVKNPTENALELSDKVFEATANFCFEVLKVNYPALTREQFDSENLITIHQSNVIAEIVQGQHALESVLDSKKNGEVSKTEVKRM